MLELTVYIYNYQNTSFLGIFLILDPKITQYVSELINGYFDFFRIYKWDNSNVGFDQIAWESPNLTLWSIVWIGAWINMNRSQKGRKNPNNDYKLYK